MTQGVRINRFIAACGVCSRRKADLLVMAGRISVNLKVCTDPSRTIDPESDVVKLDGDVISIRPKLYIAMNKPRGLVCSVSDRFSPTVLELLPSEIPVEGLFPVGRLDKGSEGLLLLTNDGEMAQRILHPSHQILKTYEVLLDATAEDAALESFMKGTEVEGRTVRPERVVAIPRRPEGRWISVTLSEGLKREIRVMAATRGFKVVRLVRTRIGRLDMKRLRPGEFMILDGKVLLKMILHGGSV
ncbi:MAG TPA: pseudouridine synthase [Synergistales bacterium]|nr:pseudouridine synthase [Synergistales bacterium]HQO83409.1 pseudouridine synthase [Synergistales bacterium]